MAKRMQMICKYFILLMTQRLTLRSDDSTQICACHNVTKADVVDNIKNSTCKTLGEVKSCTKAGTGCGGCLPLVQSILNKTMLEMGQEVSNHCKSPGAIQCDSIANSSSMLSYPLLSR